MAQIKLNPNNASGPKPGSEKPALADDSVLAKFVKISNAALSTPSFKEAATIIVTRLGEILPVDRVVLVKCHGTRAIQAVSTGTDAPRDNRFADAVDEIRQRFSAQTKSIVVPQMPSQNEDNINPAAEVQQAMEGTSILWVPLCTKAAAETGTPPEYALWIERWKSAPWFKEEMVLLDYFSPFFSHALTRRFQAVKKSSLLKRILWSLLGVFILCLFIPIQSRIVSPGRVVPEDPHYVFAPFDGILNELHVEPGELVEKDSLLFSYDARVLDKRLEEAYQTEQSARAELFRLEGAAYDDEEALGKIPVQQLEVERAQSDVAFYKDQRQRGEVTSAIAGIVVLDDPDALIGASIQTGENIMSIADPAKTKVRIMVPVADAGLIELDAEVEVRLDRDPLSSLYATVSHVGFEVILSDEQVPSVLVEAKWTEKPENIQPGQRGSAKIYAETTFLGLQLFRRPLIVLREITGL